MVGKPVCISRRKRRKIALASNLPYFIQQHYLGQQVLALPVIVGVAVDVTMQDRGMEPLINE
jgi:hypothetical protein